MDRNRSPGATSNPVICPTKMFESNNLAPDLGFTLGALRGADDWAKKTRIRTCSRFEAL
jgi:hypothetical protein